MFTPIASIHSGEISINGEGSILNRPFEMVQAPLGALGVIVTTQNGYLPITVQGPLRGGRVTADGSLSSQFITGLLMALPYVESDSILEVRNLVSRPYVDLTLKILDEFGVHVVNNNYSQFEIKGGQEYIAGNFSVEGDWSGAAFLLVIGAIAGQVTVTGLDLKSPQADKAVLDALKTAGAEIIESGDQITVSRGGLRAFEFDLSDCPDLAPPLTVLALACRGKTVLKGAKRLAAKESNRGIALEETMNIIGGRVKNYGSSVEIEGGDELQGGSASSFNDHRIAMALASAALLCKTPVRITGMECINKSYPGFMDDYISIGGNIKNI
jgi:3-phosphoshikimate 1-carboxyvinyltransferase